MKVYRITWDDSRLAVLVHANGQPQAFRIANKHPLAGKKHPQAERLLENAKSGLIAVTEKPENPAPTNSIDYLAHVLRHG